MTTQASLRTSARFGHTPAAAAAASTALASSAFSESAEAANDAAIDPELPRGGSQRAPVSTRRRATGDWRVCSKVLRQYLPLVYQVVGSMARRLPANVLRDDLVAAGVFGLVDSLRKNGNEMGEAFEWYARTRIRGAIVDELRAQDWLPRRARRAASNQSTTPRWSMVVSVEDVHGLEDALHAAVATEDPVEQIEARSQHRALARAIELLPERERRIVGMHYFKGLRFKDIGAELGVSEPRISQLHARAIGRLRGLLDAA